MSQNAIGSRSSIQVCSISLCLTNIVRLIGVPVEVIPHLRNAIKSWGPIQSQIENIASHDFRLVGHPWLKYGGYEVLLPARTLVAAILTCMAQNGWNLLQSFDVNQTPGDKDTLIFENAPVDPDVHIFYITFYMDAGIRITKAHSLVPYVREAIKAHWSGRIEAEYHDEFQDAFDFRLTRNPKVKTVQTCVLLNQIIVNFRSVGYKFYGSIGVNSSGGQDLETWFFRSVGPSWGGNEAPGSSLQVCSISLNMTDRLRLIGVPLEVTQHVRKSIVRNFYYSPDEREYNGAHELKLNGNPWNGQGSETVSSRHLILNVLKSMAQNGWNLIGSSYVSTNRSQDKDALFFETAAPDPNPQMFCVTFNMRDSIRVIGASNIVPYVQQVIKTHWAGKIRKEEEDRGAFEFTLAENSNSSGVSSEIIQSTKLLNQIIITIRSVGYKLYGSLVISKSYEGKDIETWIFRRVGSSWP